MECLFRHQHSRHIPQQNNSAQFITFMEKLLMNSPSRTYAFRHLTPSILLVWGIFFEISLDSLCAVTFSPSPPPIRLYKVERDTSNDARQAPPHIAAVDEQVFDLVP